MERPLKVLTREDVAELLKTALVKYALRENHQVCVEMIDGVCSWGIGVCPEFSFYAWEDDCLTLCDWATEFYKIPYLEAVDKLDRNEFPFHLISVWEYEGEDIAYGSTDDYYPHQHSFDKLVSIFYDDYLAYVKAVEEILAE